MSKAKDAAAAGTPAGTGPINSRTEAYRRLEEAAEWLMANEPHSPTPYLIRRAVSWRDKSLGELMSDETSRTFLMSLYEMLSANEGQFGGMDDEDS